VEGVVTGISATSVGQPTATPVERRKAERSGAPRIDVRIAIRLIVARQSRDALGVSEKAFLKSIRANLFFVFFSF
jgi:hypothetical protein